MVKQKLIDTNKKIANTVVKGYKKVEETVVSGYTKIEDKFVDKYLRKENESIKEAKKRLKAEQKVRDEKQKEYRK